MPPAIEDLRRTKDYVREYFPMEDKAEIFGLHKTATVKAKIDMASDIMEKTYIY